METFSIVPTLDLIKQRHGLSSYYAVSKKIGLPIQNVAHWIHQKALPGPTACLALADAAGIDRHVFCAQVQAARTRHKNVRAMWLEVVQRLEQTAPIPLPAPVVEKPVVVTQKRRFSAPLGYPFTVEIR